jgi:hypothetical protein
MVSGKMKLLAAAVATATVIASLAFAALAHNKVAAVDHGFVAHHAVGPDGNLIGSAGNASLRSQWQQEGLPE